MKSKRHAKILELIADYPIDTQEELLRRLNASGFTVTQATVSRDIKELRLIKTQSSNGGYHYTTVKPEISMDVTSKFQTMLTSSVHSIDYAGNMVVIKCYTGLASAACVALDANKWKGVVGTLAGEDTIFMVMRTAEDADAITHQLRNLMKE